MEQFKSYNLEKNKIKQKLKSCREAVLELREYDLDVSEALEKIDNALKTVDEDIIRIVLVGAFSDGKTSSLAGWLGKKMADMNIDIAESSNEIEIYKPQNLDEQCEIVDTPGLFGTKKDEYTNNKKRYELYAYCIAKLYSATMLKLEKMGGLELFSNIEMPMVEILSEMQYTGIFVDKKELLKEFNNSKTCVGIVMIDNYEEILQRIATEEKPQVLAEIEKLLYDWAATTEGIMIKNERDTFVYVFEQKYLAEMLEEKFSILDKIKEIRTKEKLQITLSIAVSNDGNTNYEKYQSANDAMDIALRKRRRSSSTKNRWQI